MLYIKISNTAYYQRNREVILNKVKDYYKNQKGKLRQQATDKYMNLSEEEKINNREYGKNRYHICLKKRSKY